MTRYFRQIVLASFFTGVLSCGLWVLPSSADACCIYNHTSHSLAAAGSVFSDEMIDPSSKQCSNGKGGTYTLFLMDSYHEHQLSTSISMKVDKHGWISVYKKSDGKWKVVSHHKDGSVKETKHLHPKN